MLVYKHLPPHVQTVVDLLHHRADTERDRTIYTFLVDGEVENAETVSCGELRRQATAIAARLRAKGLSQGDRVLLLHPPSLDYIYSIYACLLGGFVAVPAYPPDPARLHKTLPRLQAIIDDCRPAAVLSTPRINLFLRSIAAVHGLSRVPVLGRALRRATHRAQRPHLDLRGARCVSSNVRPSPRDRVVARVQAEDVALLQYTSGSTSAPKGVVVTHSNIMQNQEMMRRTGSFSEESVLVGWTPLYHDMGIMVNVLQTLFSNASSVMMSPLAFLQRPARWLRVVDHYRATHSGGPNFAFDLCAKKVTDDQLEGVDLSSWQMAFSSSEPVRASTLDAFTRRFAGHGLRRDALWPCYGMADTTLIISGPTVGEVAAVQRVSKRGLARHRVSPPTAPADTLRIVTAGVPCDGSRVVVTTAGTCALAAPDEVGELWVSGPHVAQGYWRSPDKTRMSFGVELEPSDGHRYLRTGDLGFLRDGEVYLTGRIKDVIIVRGRNLYGHDIEAAVHALAGALPEIRLGCTTAFGATVDDHEVLVVFQEVDPDKRPGADLEETARAIRGCVLAEFQAATHAVVLLPKGALPKTSSGKLQRFACQQAFESDFEGWHAKPVLVSHPRLRAGAPAEPGSAEPGSSGLAEWVYAAVESVCALPVGSVRGHMIAADIGMDSLKLTELAQRIEEGLGVTPDLSRLVDASTPLRDLVSDLARHAPVVPGRAPTPGGSASIAAASITSPVATNRVHFRARRLDRIAVKPGVPPALGAYGQHVNPYIASMLADMGLAVRFVGGSGTELRTASGDTVLDCISQYGALPFGYNPPRIWAALEAARHDHEPSFVQPSILGVAGELAERLVALCPGMAYVTYANSGAEAVEAAIKLARSATGRLGILSTSGGFHGKTLGALSATHKESYQAAFGAPTPGFERVPYGDLEALDEALAGGTVAAFLVEPLQGEGGIVVPPEGYLREAARLCRRWGVLLVLDEVQTGLGRTGAMLACTAEGVAPDMLVLAKALGGGLVPMGAVLCTSAVYNRDYALKHSSTFAGNALGCRAALAALDWLQEDDEALVRHVRATGAALRKDLQALADAHPTLVSEVRGRGFMLGMKLAVDRYTWRDSMLGYLADQGLLALLVCGMLLHDEGIRLAPTLSGTDVLRIEPPLIATSEECQRIVHALGRTLTRLEGGDVSQALQHILGAPRGEPVEVTAAPRGPVVAPAGATRFAFLVHPLDAKSLLDMDPRLGAFDASQRQALLDIMDRQADPFVVGEVSITSPTGRSAVGTFVVVPHSTEQLSAMAPAVAIDHIEEALELALASNPEIIGLGGFTSVVTQGGLLLQRQGLPAITSGSVTTAIAGGESIDAALALRGRRADTTAILGAAGHVGSASAVLATQRTRRLVLVGNPAHHARSMEALRSTMRAVLEALADTTPAEGTLLARAHALGGTREAQLDALIARGELVLTTDPAAIGLADVIITATSATGTVLDGVEVMQGAILCDLARPFNVPAAIAGRDDVTYIEGGIMDLPGAADLGFDAGLAPGQAFACMVETMLLALERRYDLPLVGHRVSAEALRVLTSLAAKHGFRVADVFNVNTRAVAPNRGVYARWRLEIEAALIADEGHRGAQTDSPS